MNGLISVQQEQLDATYSITSSVSQNLFVLRLSKYWTVAIPNVFNQHIRRDERRRTTHIEHVQPADDAKAQALS